MTKYLFIESRDPFDSATVENISGLAKDLQSRGHDVTLFLVQNGVLPARRSPRSGYLAELVEVGVKILADDYSLEERGIANDRLMPGISAAQLEVVVDELAAGTKTIWH